MSVVGKIDSEVIAFAYFQTDGAIQAHLSLLSLHRAVVETA